MTGRWSDLAALLEQIAKQHPNEYAQYRLAYLRARALVEMNEAKPALFDPFLAASDPFREFALFHRAELEEGEAASRDRQTLIFSYPNALYRDEAIDDETEWLSGLHGVQPLLQFQARLLPSAPTTRRRDLDAHLVEMLVRLGDGNGALQRGMNLLRGGTVDDPSDRVSRAIDRPELVRHMNAEQFAILGDSMQNHRHYDRAVALLSVALKGIPQKRNDLVFAIGRSYFGDEKFALAQQAYMTGANGTRDPQWKATFLWHAARAAQLQNDDATAERLMTAAIAVPGRFPATSAALTQRLRTRLKQKRFAEAAADLNAIRAGWPKDHALVDASIAYAVGMIGAGNNGAAVVTLNAIPSKLLDPFEPYEIDYWRARATSSFAFDLSVLRAPQPTHFAYFARDRVSGRAAQEAKVRDSQVAALIAKGQWDAARRVETDRVLLAGGDLHRLAEIYRHVPQYNAVLTLTPEPFPKFPLPPNADRMSLLMAMGLFDEAANDVHQRWPLHSMKSDLTQSLALNRGNASKESIFAIEVLMKSVPADYIPQLLPQVVRELLYPRYFYDAIAEDSKRFGSDPLLVEAIMREESRFDPRAKSQAAARGLLQFIITTARDIGQQVGFVNVTPEDLYDPRVIIQLGAKYVNTLSKELGNDPYRTVAAYNAGPKQVKLWSRIAPMEGDDYFLSSINFDETKQYVRKVMNSYKRYAEIYGNAGPQGGVRMEP